MFYKVKSRSAHMKSHAEQERKAAAQHQREEEERAAKTRQEMLEAQRGGQEESSGAEESSVELDDEKDVDWHWESTGLFLSTCWYQKCALVHPS